MATSIDFAGYCRSMLGIKDDTLVMAAVMGYNYRKMDEQWERKNPREGDIFENIITKHTYRFDGERWVEEE